MSPAPSFKKRRCDRDYKGNTNDQPDPKTIPIENRLKVAHDQVTRNCPDKKNRSHTCGYQRCSMRRALLQNWEPSKDVELLVAGTRESNRYLCVSERRNAN